MQQLSPIDTCCSLTSLSVIPTEAEVDLDVLEWRVGASSSKQWRISRATVGNSGSVTDSSRSSISHLEQRGETGKWLASVNTSAVKRSIGKSALLKNLKGPFKSKGDSKIFNSPAFHVLT